MIYGSNTLVFIFYLFMLFFVGNFSFCIFFYSIDNAEESLDTLF